MNEDKIKGKWLELKGEIQKAWGRLTDDELEQTKGDLKSVEGLIQQKYGDSKETYSQQLNDLRTRIEDKKDSAVSKLKSSLKS